MRKTYVSEEIWDSRKHQGILPTEAAEYMLDELKISYTEQGALESGPKPNSAETVNFYKENRMNMQNFIAKTFLP